MGCGWLGLPLAVSLIKEGFHVHGSTTSEQKVSQLKKKGVIPFKISLREDKIEGAISDFLRDVDVLIVNVPPKLRGKNNENYVQKIQLLYQEAKKSRIEKVIL